MESTGLALFDFDGTISFKDSFLEFIKYRKGKTVFYLNMMLLSPVLVLMKLGVIPNQKAKELVLQWFFKGEDENKFKKASARFAETVLPAIVKDEAYRKILGHKKDNDRVVVVSASMDIWLKAWCEQLGIELICSRLHFENGKFTGKLATPNCQGEEKVRRIKAQIDLKDYHHIYAYGNSSGDNAMFAIADKVFYKNFN